MSRKSKQTSRPILPLVLAIVGLILLVVAGLLFFRNQQPAESESIAGGSPAPLESNPAEIPRVSLDEAKQAFDESSAVFVDVRSTGAYAQAHIPNALSIPLDDIPDRVDEVDPNNWIITYCT